MKNEVRNSVVISAIMIGVLAVAGIIGYMIVKRRRKEMEDIETVDHFKCFLFHFTVYLKKIDSL